MTIYIFVSEGAVEEVLGTEDYQIIDYDELDAGKCPICGGEIIPTVKCSKCGMDYEGAHSNREIMLRHQEYWKEAS